MPHDVVLQAQVFGLGVEMDPLQGLAGVPGTRRTTNYLHR